jgi:hypothetical protein
LDGARFSRVFQRIDRVLSDGGETGLNR